jgi:hypothetical protein
MEQDTDIVHLEWHATNWDTHGTTKILATFEDPVKDGSYEAAVIQITVRAITGELY